MMKKRYVFYGIILLFAMCLQSCKYDTIEVKKCENISFANDIQSIFNEKCVTCHTGGSAPMGLELTAGNSYNNLIDGSYIDTNNPEESKLYEKAKSNHNGATADDACKILGWITEGALEGEPLIDTIKFNSDLQPFFNDYCIKCHITGHTSGLDLTPNNSFASIESNNLFDISNPSESDIYIKLLDDHGSAPDANIADILKWIEQGAQSPTSDYPVVAATYDDIQNIFNAYCVYCHYPNSAEGIDLTPNGAYNTITDSNLVDTIKPAESKLYTTIANGHYGNASGVEYWKILTWIEDGAPVTVPPVSFSSDIEPLFTSIGCIGCHSHSGQTAGLDLTTGYAYQSLVNIGAINTDNPEQSELYLHASSGHNGATSDLAALVLRWIQEGANNNK